MGKHWNGILLLAYHITAWPLALHQWQQGQTYAGLLALVGGLLPGLPWLLFSRRGKPLSKALWRAYLIFCYGAVVLGGGARFYHLIPLWDKLLHTFSGVLLAAGGMALYWRWSGNIAFGRWKPGVIFAGLFGVSCGVFWEFYEYVLLLFGNDAMNTRTTGVHDTMWDLMVCAIGAAIACWDFYRYYERNKKGWCTRLALAFGESSPP